MEDLKPGQLKIYYKGGHDNQLDSDLCEVLSKHGFTMWAAGYNFVEDLSDTCFEKIVKEEQ